MNQISYQPLKATLIVPFGLILVLIPFSLFIGWNLYTGILFWYVITPALAIYLPSLFLPKKTHWLESLLGLTIFYAIIVFMTYSHYKTDYFKIMLLSFVINIVVILGILWIKKSVIKKQGIE